MKIKWGMMMTDGRGKLGGQVASKNRAGAYVRTKVTPVNPQTQYQSAVRQLLGVLSKEWGALDDTIRQRWITAADSGDYNTRDIFGDARRPTGQNLYVGMNIIWKNATNTLLTNPPFKANFGIASGLRITNLNITQGDIDIAVAVSGDIQPGTRWEVQATAPVSAGRTFLKNEYRSISYTNMVVTGDQGIDIHSQYINRFGALTANDVGRRIGFRIRQVVDGQVTPWLSVSGIIEDTP